jgi:hypothetical protein
VPSFSTWPATHREGTVRRLLEKIERTQRLVRQRTTAGAAVELSAPRVLEEAVSVSVDRADAWDDDADASGVPEAETYRFARLGHRNSGTGVLSESTSSLVHAIGEVSQAESPVHQDDVMNRLATAYGDQRVGSRIARHLEAALTTAESRGVIVRRGGFVWEPNGEVHPRSRSGTGIPAERIAPEEYEVAALMVLRAGTRPRPVLVAATRTLLGYNRTGTKLEERIDQAIDFLVREGKVGEGSAGLAIIEAVR